MRPIGMPATMSRMTSCDARDSRFARLSVSSVIRSVAMKPGHTTLTVIPSAATSPAFWGSRRPWPTRSPPRGSPSTSCVPASSRRSGSRSSRRAARSASHGRRRRSCATWSRAFRSAAWAAPTSSPRRLRSSRPSGPAILPAPCYRWTAGLRDPFSNASRISHPASRVSMKAIVKEQRVPGLKVATVPKPSAGPGEVLIAVRHAGVCGTDVHIADWDAWAQGRIKPPLVVGHEFAGEIVAAGDGVSELRPGQLVTAEGHIVCGHCLQCRTGNSHICKNTRIIGVDRDGAFAEYIAMPATNVLPLDGVPATVGAIMDPMGNAFHAVLTAEIQGSSVFVVGCGPIGCFAVGIARAAGAAKVIASDVNVKRLELARRMGAHVTIDAATEDVVRRVREETGGEGADVVCEMSGVPSALHQAFAAVRLGGRVQLLGIPKGEVPIDFASELICKGMTVYGG